jgi:GDPmannose 4,6-dehydratase
MVQGSLAFIQPNIIQACRHREWNRIMSQPAAIITGITGQDGSYLSELLLRKGYIVHGIVRAKPPAALATLAGVECHIADLRELEPLKELMAAVKPQEVYHLAAQSHVRSSFEDPLTTADINAMGTLRLLEAVRRTEDALGRRIRFFHASSAEIFGPNENSPHTEQSTLNPQSPYGISKAFAHLSVRNYRKSFGMHASNGILFNHESPRRPESFVTRKITLAAARIAHGMQKQLTLGSMDAKRDWGYAGDFVEGMWRMLQQDEPGDYILATGRSHSVKDFVNAAFNHAGLNPEDHVVSDTQLLRPTAVSCLAADPSKAKNVLGWKPRVGFVELVQLMVEADLERIARETLSGLRHAS